MQADFSMLVWFAYFVFCFFQWHNNLFPLESVKFWLHLDTKLSRSCFWFFFQIPHWTLDTPYLAGQARVKCSWSPSLQDETSASSWHVRWVLMFFFQKKLFPVQWSFHIWIVFFVFLCVFELPTMERVWNYPLLFLVWKKRLPFEGKWRITIFFSDRTTWSPRNSESLDPGWF